MDAALLRSLWRLPLVVLAIVAVAPGVVAARPAPGPLETDDRPQPLVARQSRSEVQQDRMEALALFAAGRTHEQREEFNEALRCYQRALRCDPTAATIVEEIVPLAVHQKQYAVAVRYAMKVADVEDVRPLLLRRLGVYLTETGAFPQAVALYEKVLAARAGASEDATDILLRMEMGRLYHIVEQYKKAAEQFARVLDALAHPDRIGLDQQVRKALLGEPGPTYQLIGEAFLLSDRLAEAAAAFEKSNALAANPALLQYNRARVAARAGKPDQALTALQASFEKHLATEGLAPYELLAQVLKKLGKEKELIDRLEKLRAADPAGVPLGYFLAGQYQQAKELDKAELLYVNLMKKSPTTTAFRALAKLYHNDKRIDALLALLGDAVEKTGTLDVLGSETKAIGSDAELLRRLIEAARQKFKVQPEKSNSPVPLAVAQLALERKQYATAGEFFELALKTRPKQTTEILLTWGVGLLLDERSAEAVKVFQRGIALGALPKTNPAFEFYLAGALAMSDRIDEALAAARRAAEIKKDSARFASRVPWILYRAKRYSEAIAAYTELVKKFDGDRQSAETREVLREARLALSNLCVLTKQLAAAEEWLDQVLDEFPDDISAANDLGYLWADAGKHLERALRMVQKAVAAEPDNMAYRDSLGWIFYRLGRYPEAIAELQKAAHDKKPDAVILDHLGDAYLRAGQPQQAKDAWRRAADVFRQEKELGKVKEMEAKITAGK